MIRAIDKRVIALHQALVNATGNSPRWLAGTCAWVMLITPWLATHLAGWWWPLVVWAGLFTPGAALLILFAHYKDTWDVFSAEKPTDWATRLSGVLLSLLFLALVLWSGDVFGAFLILPIIVYTSYLYFAACKEPPPPPPRTRTTLATEGAS